MIIFVQAIIQIIQLMYDPSKVQELQNRSHVRGVLFKQMHLQEEMQRQRKRKEMKAILDQQVEERRKQKELDKRTHERIIQQEDQSIKQYANQIQIRQRKSPPSNAPQQMNRVGIYESKVTIPEKIQKNHNRIPQGDIPLMPVMQTIDKVPSNQSNTINSPTYALDSKNSYNNSDGNIPLLDLAPEKPQKKRLKSKNPSKRQETKKTQPDKQFSLSGSRQHTDFKEIFGDLNQQLESQNKQLKKQLRKNQQAISLLIGAVRSNAKFDKFRVQAQKILYGGIPQQPIESRVQKSPPKQVMLPKLKVKNQSIMHDYLFGSAKKAAVKGKTYK